MAWRPGRQAKSVLDKRRAAIRGAQKAAKESGAPVVVSTTGQLHPCTISFKDRGGDA